MEYSGNLLLINNLKYIALSDEEEHENNAWISEVYGSFKDKSVVSFINSICNAHVLSIEVRGPPTWKYFSDGGMSWH